MYLISTHKVDAAAAATLLISICGNSRARVRPPPVAIDLMDACWHLDCDENVML